MIKNILLILCIVSCTSINANSGKSDKGFLYEGINKLSPFIDMVQQCGEWDENNKGGYIRVVKGYLYGHAELFLQWISVPLTSDSKDLPKLLATAPVREFTYSNSDFVIEKYSCDKKNNSYEINLVLTNANDDDHTYKANIKPLSIGKYKYTETRLKN